MPDQLVSRPHPAWVIAVWVIAVIAARRLAEGGYGPWVMDLLVATIAERPDLAPLLRDFPGGWPDFMYEDPIASIYYGDAVRAYPEFVRAGGRIVRVAPRSMVIPGTLDEWRQWTGLAFDKTGPVHVPQALTPVHCDTEHDHAVYVEPNVWVHHPL